jgi:hypothetical protein
MSEGTPISRNPGAYDRGRRSSADDDAAAGFGGAAADAGRDDPDIDAEELRSSSDDDQRAALGGSVSDQDDRDVADADDITLRLTEGR